MESARPSSPISPAKFTLLVMSRKGVGSNDPFRKMRMVPACSTMNNRPVPSSGELEVDGTAQSTHHCCEASAGADRRPKKRGAEERVLVPHPKRKHKVRRLRPQNRASPRSCWEF